MKTDLPHKQKGAVAIEFALVFVIFFAVFYAIVSYSLPLLLAVIVGLLFGLKGRGHAWQKGALLFSSLYLVSTLGGKFMAEQQLEQALKR